MLSLLSKNRDIFFYFVNLCNEQYRSGHDLDSYREIIRIQRESENYSALLDDDDFLNRIIDTLRLWNMDQRGARLTSVDKFKKSVQHEKDALLRLHNYKLHSTSRATLQSKISKAIEPVFLNLKVMESKSKLVGVSKALHFLLPDLVLPIDNKYTITVVYYKQKSSNDPTKEFKTFVDVLIKSYELARGLCLVSADVSGDGWNTTIPKLIDNAFIGFYKFFFDSGREVNASLEELQKQFPGVVRGL